MNLQLSEASAAEAAEPGQPGKWPARLDLDYSLARGQTVVHRRHVGPLLIQRPFYPEDDGTCHNYLLHPPGGVAGGDTLEINVSVAPEAQCLLTAPGATKVYRAPREPSRHKIDIRVAQGGVCEYMPMETIVFDGARTHFETHVDLASDAIFFGWDLVSLGRPAAKERFDNGYFSQVTTINRDNQMIWYERARIDGDAPLLDAAYGFNGCPIFGTALYAGHLPEGAIDALRDRVSPPREGTGAITQVDNIIVCRFLGTKVAAGRGFFAAAWDVLRQLGQGKPAVIPRIWAT